MEELQDLKNRLERERPTPWDELPDIALYMDQLIQNRPHPSESCTPDGWEWAAYGQ